MSGTGIHDGPATRDGRAAGSLNRRPQWQALLQHVRLTHERSRGDLFTADPGRGKRLRVEAARLYLDYSKQRIGDDTMRLLLELGEGCGVRAAIETMFAGAHTNTTKAGPSCTSPCARRRAHASKSMV